MELGGIVSVLPYSYDIPINTTRNPESLTGLYSSYNSDFVISEDAQNSLVLAQSMGVEDMNFSATELKELDSLFTKLDSILGVDGLPELTEAQSKELDKIDQEIDKIFQAAGDKPLTAAQEKQLDALFDKEEKLLGISSKTLSAEDEKKLDQIEQRIDQIFASKLDSSLTASEKTDIAIDNAFAQLDKIFGYGEELNSEQQKKVDKLNEEIDKILGSESNTLTKAQEDHLEKLFSEIDKIYEVRSYDSLSASEKTQVDKLFAQLEKLIA